MGKPTTALAIALAAALAIALAVHWLQFYSPLPGISIAVELAGFPADAAASVFVVASAPPNAPGDFVELYAGTYDGRPIYFSASGKLGELAKGWVNAYRARGSDVEGLETGLIVFVSVYNKTALSEGRVQIYQTTADVVSYKPAEVIADKSVLYAVSVDRGRHGFARIAKQEVKMPIPVKPADGAEARLSFAPVNPEVQRKCDYVATGEGGVVEECWERVYYLGVENLTSTFPADYFREFNDKLYMKVPVLILYNNYSYSKPESAVVGATINLEQTESKVGVYVTFQAGPQLGAVFKGESAYLPSVTVWKSELFAWGGQKYYGGLGVAAKPNDWAWGYFWGRPAMAIYKHYWIIGLLPIHDSNDYAVYAITDFYVVDNRIQGEAVSGKPNDALMDMFFQGSTEMYVGALRPGYSIPFGAIFDTFDTCGADFEVGIPVGSIVAALNPWAAALAGGIGVSTYISGGVSNYGAMGIGHDVYEDIYIRVSKYEYVQGNCEYNVPIGIYIDSR